MNTLLELVKTRHADWEAAWTQLCALVEAAYEAEPEALAAAMPAMLKGLKKWPRADMSAPARWLQEADSLAPLLPLARNIKLAHHVTPLRDEAIDALLAADLSSARLLTISDIALSAARLTLLCQNASLTGLSTLALTNTGLKEDGLSRLLDADALWTSLHTLILAESGVTARCATLLANSPRLAGLKELGLTGSRIGPAGRAALSASPHLPDRAKRKAKLPVAARTTSEPPAPREIFGDLRSLLQAAPSEHAWDMICDMFDRLEHSPERERVEQELIPYAQSRLATWPAAMRLAPMPWLREVMDGRPAPLGLQLARDLILDLDVARVEAARNLSTCPQLAQIEALDLSRCSASPSALIHLLSGIFAPSLRRLRLHPETTNYVSLGQLHLTAAALPMSHLVTEGMTCDALGQLKELELFGHSTDTRAQWAAVLAAPWFPKLEVMAIEQSTDYERDRALQAADALPLDLRELRIMLPNARDARDAAASWIARCQRLEALTLGLLTPMTEADERTWSAIPPAALRALTLKLQSGTLNNVPRRLLAAGWLGELTQLSLHGLDIVGFDLGDMLARFQAAQRIELHSITSLALGQRLAQRLDNTQLRHLSISRCQTDPSLLDHLSHTSRWPELRSLSFKYNNGFGHERPATYDWVAQLPEGLEVLEIQGEPGLVDQLPALLQSPAAATLRSLSLERCGLGPRTIAALVEVLSGMKRLERLDLSGNNHLNEYAIHQLLESPRLPQLSRLTLRHTYLGVRARTMLMTAPDIQLAAKAHMFAPADLR